MKHHIIYYFIILSINLLFSAQPNPIYGKNGMVVSTSQDASLVGINILKKGGNAIDAAVAVAFALAVVNPSAGNIGGGGFMLIHLAEKNETISIDYRERAPIKSFEKMFQDSSGKVIKGLSLNSILASGVCCFRFLSVSTVGFFIFAFLNNLE